MKRKEAPSGLGTTLGPFYCGCAGFANSNWVGNFYPRKLVGSSSERQLNHYQQHFNSVEINGTFYGLPTDATISKWKRHAGKGFKFILKAKKSITHEGPQLNSSELEIFLERAMLLGNEALAVVLLQCPQSLAVDLSQLESVKDVVCRVGYRGQLALEFRNAQTYRDEQVRAFLSRNNWALVYHPNSVGRYTVGNNAAGRGERPLVDYEIEDLQEMVRTLEPTADFVYIRLHGTNDEHACEYTTTQLDTIASQLHAWRTRGLAVFVFLLNDLAPSGGGGSPKKASSTASSCEAWSAMPKNAHQLLTRVYSLANETPPRAPKQPRSTITSFFSPK